MKEHLIRQKVSSAAFSKCMGKAIISMHILVKNATKFKFDVHCLINNCEWINKVKRNKKTKLMITSLNGQKEKNIYK